MLRRQILSAVLTVALAASAGRLAAQPKGLSPAEAVIAADKRLNAFIVSHDDASAAALYDDDFLLTVSSGATKRKSDMLADIANRGITWTACETQDVVVRVRGNTAVLTGTLVQTGRINDRPFDVRLRVTDTWVDVDGRWVLLAGHASPAK